TISESSSKEKSRPCWIEFHNKTRTIRRRASRGGRIRSPRRARKIYFAGGIELYRGHIARVLTGGHPKICRPDDLPGRRQLGSEGNRSLPSIALKLRVIRAGGHWKVRRVGAAAYIEISSGVTRNRDDEFISAATEEAGGIPPKGSRLR